MQQRIKKAVSTLNSGGVIAYPTEAVFGLGCDPWDEQAALKILDIKERPIEKGLILIAAEFNQLSDFIEPVPASLLEQINATWPGPVTWLLPVRKQVPEYITGEHPTIAVRVTAHKQTAALCRAFGGAIISTSANRASKRPAKHAFQVQSRLPEVDFVLPGACIGSNRPSQIRDGLTGKRLR